MYQKPLPESIDERSEAIQYKLRRALLGALYGLLGGTVFTAAALLADRLFYPHLPMGIDWDFYRAIWTWLGPGLMLVGFVTAWWHETWSGLLTGTLAAATVLLLSNMPGSAATPVQKFATFIIVFLPAATICLPVVYFFRWLVKRSFMALRQNRAGGRILLLFLLVILVSGLGGLFMRMPARAVDVVTKMEASLQTIPDAKSALRKLTGLDAHRGQPFELYYAKSTYTTQGYDVRAVYKDGYVVTCAVVVYADAPPFLTRCQETTP